MAARATAGAPSIADQMIDGRSLASFMTDDPLPGASEGSVYTGNEEANDAGLEPSGLLGNEEADDVAAQAAEESELVNGEDGAGSDAAAAAVAGAQTADAGTAAAGSQTAQTPRVEIDPEELNILRQNAQVGQAWQQRYATNPAETLGTLLKELHPAYQRMALDLAGIKPPDAAGGAAQEEQVDVSTLTPQEKWVHENKGKIALSDHLAQLEQKVAGALRNRDEMYGDGIVASLAQEHINKAVLGLLGIDIPPIDNNALLAAVNAGKPLKQAVADVYAAAVADAVTRHKQKVASNGAPKTPAGAGKAGGDMAELKGLSLAQIMQKQNWL